MDMAKSQNLPPSLGPPTSAFLVMFKKGFIIFRGAVLFLIFRVLHLFLGFAYLSVVLAVLGFRHMYINLD